MQAAPGPAAHGDAHLPRFYHVTDEDLGTIIAFLPSLPPTDGPLTEIRLGPLARIGRYEPQVAMIDGSVSRPITARPTNSCGSCAPARRAGTASAGQHAVAREHVRCMQPSRLRSGRFEERGQHCCVPRIIGVDACVTAKMAEGDDVACYSVSLKENEWEEA